MTEQDILKLRDTAEQTRVQFKERVTRDNKYDVSCEMVALSNSRGGMIVVGIDDKTGRINPLSFVEVQETTNLVGSLASEGVVPQILLDIENVQVEGGIVVVATVKQGRNKPYRDSKGIVWVKQGADKRKVFDNAELIAMLMENGQMHPDSMPVKGTGMKDLDENTLRDYLLNRFRSDFERQQLSIAELRHRSLDEIADLLSQTPEGILTNNGLMTEDGTLTVAALMLINEFVVTVERANYIVADRDNDREDRDKGDEGAKDNLLAERRIGKQVPTNGDEDRVEETEDKSSMTHPPYRQLTSVQKDIIQYCSIPRTAKEIMDHIGYYNNSKNMTTYVRPLLEMGVIEMTDPDKPNSKYQKYRKVGK